MKSILINLTVLVLVAPVGAEGVDDETLRDMTVGSGYYDVYFDNLSRAASSLGPSVETGGENPEVSKRLAPAWYGSLSAGLELGLGYNPGTYRADYSKAGYIVDVTGGPGSSLAAWVGRQFEAGLVLEIGATMHNPRSISLAKSIAFPASYYTYQSSFVGIEAWVMGGIRRRVMHDGLLTLGFTAGWIGIVGNDVAHQAGASGTLFHLERSLSGDYFSGGILARFEGMLSAQYSVGLELGAAFAPSPVDHTLVIKETMEDPYNYSSVYLRLYLTGWLSPPLEP